MGAIAMMQLQNCLLSGWQWWGCLQGGKASCGRTGCRIETSCRTTLTSSCWPRLCWSSCHSGRTGCRIKTMYRNTSQHPHAGQDCLGPATLHSSKCFSAIKCIENDWMSSLSAQTPSKLPFISLEGTIVRDYSWVEIQKNVLLKS